MATVRSLLAQGNGKLGSAIHTWSLPAITTCPGRSAACEGVCYAARGRFALGAVRERLAWNHAQSLRGDFADRMAREIRRKGCLVVRVHVGGDFYDRGYAEKWLAVMRHSPKARFYFYTRSWRVPEVVPVLEEMAALRCCRAWYSTDAETGLPDHVPPGVRLAHLRVAADEQPAPADLEFRVRRLRAARTPLSVVCPHETPEGRARDANCGNCGRCWR